MRGSRNFRQGGGPGQSGQRFFFCFFLVLSLFYRSQMVNFKEIYHFSRFQRGSNIFRGGGGGGGGGGGSNCSFPIETHITCDFPGGVRTPCPPFGSALVEVGFSFSLLTASICAPPPTTKQQQQTAINKTNNNATSLKQRLGDASKSRTAVLN